MAAIFESLQSEGFAITDSSRVKCLHSDRAGEFTAPYLERLLTKHKIYQTFTSGYDPQSNGTAEHAVGLVKSLAARALASAQLDCSYWSYSADMLLSLYCVMRFNDINGLYVLVLMWLPRSSITRRSSFLTHVHLLVVYSWDHTQDQVSYVPCPQGKKTLTLWF